MWQDLDPRQGTPQNLRPRFSERILPHRPCDRKNRGRSAAAHEAREAVLICGFWLSDSRMLGGFRMPLLQAVASGQEQHPAPFLLKFGERNGHFQFSHQSRYVPLARAPSVGSTAARVPGLGFVTVRGPYSFRPGGCEAGAKTLVRARARIRWFHCKNCRCPLEDGSTGCGHPLKHDFREPEPPEAGCGQACAAMAQGAVGQSPRCHSFG